ncbi:MAG: hypothetical protein IKQ48_07315, partial [Paludibacteraceae bacterium]|nr:hypothetical protein [Paludibacteraceae bacterium]
MRRCVRMSIPLPVSLMSNISSCSFSCSWNWIVPSPDIASTAFLSIFSITHCNNGALTATLRLMPC